MTCEFHLLSADPWKLGAAMECRISDAMVYDSWRLGVLYDKKT